jgi:hypothetical protein
MGRFVPEGKRAEKIFLLFVQALPGGSVLYEVIAQRLLDELDHRKGISAYGPDGSHFRLMGSPDVVAREFSGLMRYAICWV